MYCYRYVSPAVCGGWKRTEQEALCDALRAGLAYLRGGGIELFEFTRIEREAEALCRPGPR
jgi:hypothetical protein